MERKLFTYCKRIPSLSTDSLPCSNIIDQPREQAQFWERLALPVVMETRGEEITVEYNSEDVWLCMSGASGLGGRYVNDECMC